jgi:hypothetical protein
LAVGLERSQTVGDPRMEIRDGQQKPLDLRIFRAAGKTSEMPRGLPVAGFRRLVERPIRSRRGSGLCGRHDRTFRRYPTRR